MEKKTAKSPQKKAEQIELTIAKAVNEALKELGEDASELIYFEVSRNYSIKKEDVGKKFEQFIYAIRQEFGSGGRAIEALIFERLYGKTASESLAFLATARAIIAMSLAGKQSMERNVCS